MLTKILVVLGILILPLGSPLWGQAKKQALLSLPKEMDFLSSSLDRMLKRVEVLAGSAGLKGWPGLTERDAYEPPSAVLKALPQKVRKVWANEQVLWVRVNPQRWDAIVLMEDVQAPGGCPVAFDVVKRCVWRPFTDTSTAERYLGRRQHIELV